VHTLATPLVTKPDGTKYGKTEGGAIWLSADLMSPYKFYQFWLNVSDAEVPGLLRVFSFRSREEIDDLVRRSTERLSARIGQRALAEELTTLVHGAAETQRVIAASQAGFVFGKAELAQLDKPTWAVMARELPRAVVPPGFAASHGDAASTTLNPASSTPEQAVSGGLASTFSIPSTATPSIASLMVSAGTAPTLSAARRAIAEGGVYLNHERVTSVDEILKPSHLFHERYALLRRGKRTLTVIEKPDE
jgi:tyrosyl-tRNA synthetase